MALCQEHMLEKSFCDGSFCGTLQSLHFFLMTSLVSKANTLQFRELSLFKNIFFFSEFVTFMDKCLYSEH